MMEERQNETKNLPEEAFQEIALTEKFEGETGAKVVSEGEETLFVGESDEALQEVSAPMEKKVSVLAQRFYATGRRKEAIAKVWLIPGGSGNITVNDTPISEYLCRYSLVRHAIEPFIVTQTFGLFDVKATAKGGGLNGQAGALRHGIARALVAYNPSFRPMLRKAGLLTRDPRVKERKKYGRKRARRGFQFRKR